MSNWMRKLSLGRRAQMGNYFGRKMCAECPFGRCSQVKTPSPCVKKAPPPCQSLHLKPKDKGLSCLFHSEKDTRGLRTLPGSGGAKQEWKCSPNAPSAEEWTCSPWQPGIPVSQLGNEASPLCSYKIFVSLINQLRLQLPCRRQTQWFHHPAHPPPSSPPIS